MDKHGKHVGALYTYRFGSWNEAIERAGYTPRDPIDEPMDRPSECPLCEEEQGGLDFHHWRYGENELGCYLCRECHDEVHRGQGRRSHSNWLVHSVQNLVSTHLQYRGSDYEADVEQIMEQYNLPDVCDLVEMGIENA
ncbi:hypothetical protein SAMN04488124_0428 [Halogeometricum limi]|uniref:C2H2-type domain-containing protein n=2 Tax=Halogeometricum limi TaxID=555875 RepID=A0A1I6FWC2_9EURY|nr:hypothetical protein SAMN04488124_0428 [Halogeometricum limi]